MEMASCQAQAPISKQRGTQDQGVGGGRGVVLVVLEEVVRKSFFVGRGVLFSFSFLSFSCLWDKVFCCNLFHHGIVVLARGL